MDVPTPEPAPNEAVIAVERVGLCGSDVHLYIGDHPYSQYPRIQGHEFSGLVAELPESYTGRLRIGDRVAVEPLVACGACYACLRDRPNCCEHLAVIGAHRDGALRDQINVDVKTVYPVGDLDAELAALVEPVSIGCQAVERGMIGPKDRIVVYGAGPIGQAVMLAARSKGAEVMVVDLLSSRRELALFLGAEAVADGASEHLDRTIKDWTNGSGPGVIVDATGVPRVVQRAFEQVAHSGRVVLVGISVEHLSVPLNDYIRKELTVYGSRNNAGVFRDAIELVRAHRDRIRSLITHRFSLEEIQEALELAANHPDKTEKVIVEVGP
ncbi:MAG: alcohol dehydrogenase catalytic domain-containing protein [Dehalococcoidia bacterium]